MSVSLKVLRKIRGDSNGLIKESEGDDDQEVIPFYTKPQPNQVNRYDLLNDESQSESEVLADNGDVDSENVQNLGVDNKSSRRKKKKKKRKNSTSATKPSSEDLDEVERSVREVNAILGEISAGPAASSSQTLEISEKSILAVDRNYLNPKNELRSIFGAEAVEEYQTPKPIKSLPALLARLSEHGLEPKAASTAILQSEEQITNMYPFHVNSLLHISEMCKINEDYSSAAQLVERALFALEMAFHPRFDLAKGNCRLDYKIQENRALFIALFNHLRYIGQRGCYRTALELCKALLSLSPDDDPMAVVLAIDFYALRAGQYQWLLDFIEDGDARRNLSQLPNMAFGRAVAHFQLKEVEKADELLQEALIMFPGILLKLLEKCCITPDPRTQASNFFLNAYDNSSLALRQLTKLYVGRSYHLWKEATVCRWLERNTLIVLDRIAKQDPIVEDFAEKRRKRFDCKTPRPVQRHVLLSDIQEVPVYEMGTGMNFDPLPPVDSIDLYKPEESRQRLTDDQGNALALFFRSFLPSYGQEPQQQQQQQPNQVQAQPDQPQDGAVALDEPAVENATGVQLRRSVHTLLDAMRDLIANLQVQTLPESASSDREDEDDATDT